MTDVELHPWSADDLDLLRRANTPELMDQLGGVESDEQVIARHERYLRLWREGTGFQFRIVIPGHPEGVGIVGYWHRDEGGERVLEAGWSVEAQYRGRGIAPAAVVAMLDVARAAGETLPCTRTRGSTTRPRTPCAARPGSRSSREADFEVTPGNTLHTNDWVVDLGSARA